MFSTGSGSGTFKPKYGKSNTSFLPLPATFQRINRKTRLPVIIVALLFIWFFFNPLSFINYLFFTSTSSGNYPQSHPLTSRHTIETASKYIYPPIEHAPWLKQLTSRKLFTEHHDRDRTRIRSLNEFDDADAAVQKQKEDEENKKLDLDWAKNFFKNQDKIVYGSSSTSNSPELVIVTAVDFDKYSLNALTKIVQNRVDYAHLQNYGVYVRWYQEFLPYFNEFDALRDKEKSKWVRVFCMKAAMFAFPNAKWFWYLDQDALIMNMNTNLEDYMLKPSALNSVMLKDQSLIPPNGLIKTYKNAKAESVRFIFVQSNQKIETSSFLVKNDCIGKSMMDIWGDDLYLQYPNFPYGPDSALTHILQWHPFILSKTTIVPTKTIGASHAFKDVGKTMVYEDGDLLAQWDDCHNPTECEGILDIYYNKLKKPKA
ncbi:putative alpha-1,6-mannosyltransferase MNN11 [Candida viswanathii]|uniref:Putative alpha-1,6-mannosyltransferase MNN11 n=1 Tax=Candida viswanathii TaxID=5486 RepID=A0A367XSX5_9ASCO|nr:putative alpha-1,6-mannosyltransferase MNN11 [Candida viswanathii]